MTTQPHNYLRVLNREYPIEEVTVPEGTLRFVTATVKEEDSDGPPFITRIGIGTELGELADLSVNPVSDELVQLDKSVFFYCEDEDEFIALAENPVAGMWWRIV